MWALDAFFGICIGGLAYPSYALMLHEAPPTDMSLQDVMPIEWVHVEKAGTSFINTLIHIPGVCPGLPTDLRYSIDYSRVPKEYPEARCCPAQFNFWFQNSLSANCNSSAWDTDIRRIVHYGIESWPEGGFNARKGRFMMFMRQPEQRLLSLMKYSKDPLTFEELKNERSGIVTKMLTRSSLSTEDGTPPTDAEVHEAKLRLQTGFSFIGITEKWNLSMCLFNKMFNQTCHPFQFANAHPTDGSHIGIYDAEELNRVMDTGALRGWTDPYDSGVFDVATKLFEANLEKYDVSVSSCEPCWREAGVL